MCATNAGCSGIREIHCNASVPPALGTSAFDGLSTNHVKLYVPSGCKDAYAFAKGWDAFLNIIEEGEGNDGDSELKKLQAAYDELKTKYDALLKGDLNMDGKTDIEDVVTLITLDAYSGDADTFATLTDANSITVEEIGQRFGDVEYYKLNGVKVDKPTQPGIYLVKKDGKTKMIVVKK